jgi:hypothetical protein
MPCGFLTTISLRSRASGSSFGVFSRVRSKVVLATTTLLVTMTLTGTAIAQWGGGGSLYTENGVEIAVDGRVAALFTMMNALGYDVETAKGPPPLERPKFTDARSKARSSLGRPGSGLRGFEKAVDGNPGTVAQYLDAVLSLGAAPRFEAPAKPTKTAKAIAEPMRSWFNEEGGSTTVRTVSDLSKDAQKELLAPLNDVTKKLAKEVRLGDEEEQLLDDTGPQGRVVVAVNLLDAHGSLHRVKLGETTTVVVGPRTNAVHLDRAVHAVALSFARTLVEREVQKAAVAGTLADRFKTLSPATKANGATNSAAAFASELVACGLVRALVSPDACASSPLAADATVQDLLPLIEKRAKDWIDDTTLLQEAASSLLAVETAPAADAVPPTEVIAPAVPSTAVMPPPPPPKVPLPPKGGVKQP